MASSGRWRAKAVDIQNNNHTPQPGAHFTACCRATVPEKLPCRKPAINQTKDKIGHYKKRRKRTQSTTGSCNLML